MLECHLAYVGLSHSVCNACCSTTATNLLGFGVCYFT